MGNQHTAAVASRVVIDACKANPDMPAATLARQLYVKHPQLWPNKEACRSMVRGRFGAIGTKRRGEATVPREKRQAGEDWTQFLPDAWIEETEWRPLAIKGATRTLVISDQQVPFHDKDVAKLEINYGRDNGADTILLNGDVVDHYQLSVYIKDPRMRDYPAEVRAGRQFLQALRKAFPDARIVYLHGNHEDRFEKFMRVRCPELLGIPEFTWESVYGTSDYGIEVVKRQQTVKLGALRVLHGHELRVSGVFPARTLFLRAIMNAMCGDVHRSSQYSEPDMDGKVISTFTTGCSCLLHPEFMRHNKWNHGFAFVTTDAKGAFQVDNKRIIDGAIW